jgi:molybdopterin synthase catalytic subunit/molybdopterin converting factor small subunit
MQLKIYVFAGLSEHFSSSYITMDLDEETLTVDQLKKRLIEVYPDASGLIKQAFIAKNQAYASGEERLSETDEIALIPPVSGGQGAPAGEADVTDESSPFIITYKPIDVENTAKQVNRPENGAALSFVGTTREFTHGKRTLHLQYEAYAPMALQMMKQIGHEISERWPGAVTAITHRLGKVDIGEISVVIAVSTPHRNDCYEASRYAIERLKQIVPIWKKEIWEDGSEWKGHQQGPWNPIAEGECHHGEK